MGNKKEIGRFFKERINEQESQPTELVWDTILLTLERKRRFRFFIFLIGILLSIAIGLLIYKASVAHDEIVAPQADIQEIHAPKTSLQAYPEKSGTNRIDKTTNGALEKGLYLEPSPLDIHNNTASSLPILLRPVVQKNALTNNTTDTSKRQEQAEGMQGTQEVQKNIKMPGASKKIPQTGNYFVSEQANKSQTLEAAAEKQPISNTVLTNKVSKQYSKEFNKTNHMDAIIDTSRNNSSGQHSIPAEIIADSSFLKKDSLEIKHRKIVENKEDKIKKEEELLDELQDKGSLSVHAGPTHFGNLSSNYPLFLNETSRKRGSDIGFAYGVALNVHITEKFRVSMGINRLRFKYSIKNVSGGINSSGRPAIIDNSTTQFFPILLSQTDINNLNTTQDFRIHHRISYTEVPLEVAFQLHSEKLDLHILGGLDVFFLGENTIDLRSNSTGTIAIGTANYLKELSFGSHIGLNITYKLTDHTQYYIKPLFKYQFGASENIQGYRPYYFGIFTGLEFKL